MQPALSSLCAGIAAATLITASHANSQSPACWNTNLGQNLALGDDELAVGLALPFSFPLPGGGSTTSIDVSSNGFVWLVSGSSADAGCCAGSSTDLLADPARIAAVWMDLDPSSGGSVHFQATATEAVITWLGVPEFGFGGDNTVQLQLFPQGAFQITTQSLAVPGYHDLLVGVSPGNGATDPGETDLSALPFATGGVPTAYELFLDPADTRDLSGTSMLYLPDGSGGYTIVPLGPCARFSQYGQGCPGSVSVAAYEFFDVNVAGELVDVNNSFSMELVPAANGGITFRPCTQACWEPSFGTNLNLGDDEVSAAQPLGFTAVYGGVVTSGLGISSNGFVYLQEGSDSGCCDGDVFVLLNDEPRVAALWNDFDPSSGGQVAFNTFPGRAVVTWDQVPEYGTGNANTFQLQFLSNGRIVMSWQTTLITSHDVVVGFSGGRGAVDPGETDLTASLPFTTGAASTPLSLTAVGAGAPVLGSTFSMAVGALPSGSPLGGLLVGITNPGLPLDAIGMTGCSLLSDGVASLTFTPGGASVATVAIGIPTSASLAGVSLFAQGVAIAPGLNALGVIASNGGRLVLGF